MQIALTDLGTLNQSLKKIVEVRTANSLIMSDIQTHMEGMGSHIREMISPTTKRR